MLTPPGCSPATNLGSTSPRSIFMRDLSFELSSLRRAFRSAHSAAQSLHSVLRTQFLLVLTQTAAQAHSIFGVETNARQKSSNANDIDLYTYILYISQKYR